MSKRKLPDGCEVRVAGIELRAAEDEQPKIVGHAAVFNKRSVDMGFVEVIEPGAFRDAIGASDIRALLNHNADIVLGRTTSGTLRVVEDEVGLFTETTPPDTQLVRDMVLAPMARGDITQMSFAFRLKPGPDGSWLEEDEDGTFIRTIREGGVEELFDISPVTYPAYPDTTVALRTIMDVAESEQQRQAIIRRAAEHRARCLRIMALDLRC